MTNPDTGARPEANGRQWAAVGALRRPRYPRGFQRWVSAALFSEWSNYIWSCPRGSALAPPESGDEPTDEVEACYRPCRIAGRASELRQ